MQVLVIILIVAIVVALIAVSVYLYISRKDPQFTFDIGGGAPKAAGGSDTSTETGFKNRVAGLGVVSGTILGALIVRIWSMQLLSTDEYSTQAEANRTRTLTSAAPRGRILDRNGVELVTNRPSLTVSAETDVLQDEVEMQLLASLIGMPYAAVRRKIQDQTEGAQGVRTVASDVSRRVVAFINEHPYLFPGIEVEQRSQRRYPHGSLGAHVLGYTGAITREQLEWSEEHEGEEGVISYEIGDTVGQAGVEYQYESVLQGVRGEQVVYVDAGGNVIESATSVAPQSGSDVMLTIDVNVQREAEASLEKRIKLLRQTFNKECKAGSVIALDVTNGEIIALASAPTFSPSVFVGGIAYSDWERLSSEKSASPLLNRAISGQYPSASTIKPLSTFAAIDYGIADGGSRYDCQGYWTGFGDAYGIYCWEHDGHGIMGLESGIVFSCDVVFYEVGKSFYTQGIEGLQETYRRWGLGAGTGVDLPSEQTGRVPDAEWKWNYWSEYPDEVRQWQGGDTTNLAIGQGDLLVTPLQIACTYAGIANRGTVWRPHVMRSVSSPVGSGSVIEYRPEVLFEVEEADTSYALVMRGLEGVIYDESPAQAEHFNNMSVRVAGKSGTAERPGEEHTGWFVAFAPAESPRYVVAACIEEGGFGSTSAMYVVRDVLGAIYGEPDTSTSVDTSGVR